MSQLNRNAAYLYDVDGLTIWERLRVIRTFLKERKQALDLTKLEMERAETTAREHGEDSFQYKEFLIFKPQTEDLLDDCVNEIAFLEDIEARLATEAEKSRVPGKTDKEMYEINFFNEHTARLVMNAQAEMLSSGRLSPETIKSLFRNQEAMERVIELEILSPTALQLPNPIAKPIHVANTGLLLEHKER